MRLPALELQHAPTQEVLREIELEYGEIPSLFASLAASPTSLRTVWRLVSATLLHPGRVPRTTKELIALAATSLARVAPLQRLLERGLLERGLDRAVLEDLQREGETSRLPARTQELLAFARRAALRPALLTDADFTRLRRLGLDDEELAELVSSAGAISLLIQLSRSLGWVD